MIKRRRLGEIKFKIPSYVTIYETYPEIINYVCTFNLDLAVDLNKTILSLPSSMRNERRFAALIMRLWPFTCLHFPPGNMVIGGAKTFFEVLSTAHEYRLFIEQMHHEFYDKTKKKFVYGTLEGKTSFDNFFVSNVVGCGNLLEGESESESESEENGEENDDVDNGQTNKNNNKLIEGEINVQNKNDNQVSIKKVEKKGIKRKITYTKNQYGVKIKKPRKKIKLGLIAGENLSSGLDKQVFPALLTVVKQSEQVPLTTCSLTKAHIFDDGKDVIMGAGNELDIYMSHNHLRNLIKSYNPKVNQKKFNQKFHFSNSTTLPYSKIKNSKKETSNGKKIFKNVHFKNLKNSNNTNNKSNKEQITSEKFLKPEHLNEIHQNDEDEEIPLAMLYGNSTLFFSGKNNAKNNLEYGINDFV